MIGFILFAICVSEIILNIQRGIFNYHHFNWGKEIKVTFFICEAYCETKLSVDLYFYGKTKSEEKKE
jgi:hypothetical protein